MESTTDDDRATVSPRWVVSEEIRSIANNLSEGLNADVIFYNGPIAEPYDHRLIQAGNGRRRRKNVFLMLVTDGGSLDCAFRMTVWLQRAYDYFTVYITGRCKSAGTLIALGANDLVMSAEHGELGPLDIQMKEPGAPDGWHSGLDFSNALLALDNQAFQAYERFREDIIQREGDSVSREYSMKIASDMSTGLYRSAYGQLDAMRIGQARRALNIASDYGSRLLRSGRNSDKGSLDRLISDYPSHEFVIDFEEAIDLFYNVYMPNEAEYELAVAFSEDAIVPHWPGEPDWDGYIPFEFLSVEPVEDEGER